MTYTQRRRQRLAAVGICCDCGLERIEMGRVRCEDCGEYARGQQEVRNANRRYLVIATLKGALKRPEPLQPQDNALVNARVEQEAAFARMERDPSLSKWPDGWSDREYKQPKRKVSAG